MIIDKVLPFSHSLLKKAVHPGDIVIDATIGNGNDTLLLAQLVGSKGRVYGFDIQQQAIEKTAERLKNNQVLEQATLFQTGHEHVKKMIPENLHGTISAAIFNLGYLPKGDHSIVTVPETTIQAVSQLLEIIKKGGIIILVVYHGHPGGKVEKDALLRYAESIDPTAANVLIYRFVNQANNPPFVIAIEKK